MKLTPPLEAQSRRLAAACFGLVSLLSGTVLIAWRLGQPREGIFDMAPSTLVMLLGFSCAAWLCQREDRFALAKWLGCLLGVGTMTLSVLVCARFIYGYKWGGEEWLAHKLGTAEELPRVHMSRTAAFCFLLLGVAWLVQCPAFCRRRPLRQVAALLALAVLMSGGVMLLCYLLQATYYAQTAFLAAVGWFLMGAGFLITAGLDNWPLNLCLVPADETRSGRRFVWGVVSLALLLTLTVGVLGKFYYLGQEANARRSAWKALGVEADLKAAQIKDWWEERLADASYLRYTPYPARRAMDYLNHPHARTEAVFRSWLDTMMVKAQVRTVLLLDEELKVELVHPQDGNADLSAEARSAAAKALRTRKLAWSNLSRANGQDPVQMSFAVPCVVRRNDDQDDVPPAGTTALPTDRTLAVMVLQINARDRLYPVLDRWPTPSPTAETLLLRQDGDEVVILNSVRHGTNAPLTLRFRMGLRSVEVRSVLGDGKEESRLLGFDHREKQVIGVWRRIEGTPWVLLVKLDATEVYAPIVRQAWTTAALVGLLIGVAILGVGLLGRQRNLVAVQRELHLERRQRESELMFRTLAQVSPVGIFHTDAAGKCLYVNQRWCDMTGLSSEVAKGKAWCQGVHPDDRARVLAGWNQAAAEQRPFSLEFRFQRPDGGVTWVLGQDAAVPESAGEPAGRIGTITDITASKRAEVALLEISDREQVRIGQDLHDGLCQDLVVIAFSVDSLEDKLAQGETPASGELRKITTLLRQVIGQARSMARGLFPVEMEAEGLAMALQNLADQTRERHGVKCEVDYPLPVFIGDNDTATQLYRIAQEAVHNAIKHAHPKRIELRLACNLGQIELTVLDDGVGVPEPLPANGGMGLDIMEYRAKTIGGTFKIRRRDRGGTEVSCYVFEKPLPELAGNGESVAPATNRKS